MGFQRDIFRKLREEYGSREKLAGAIGITSATISNWETTDKTPDLEGLSKAAKVLGVSLDYLMGEYEPTTFRAQVDSESVSILLYMGE